MDRCGNRAAAGKTTLRRHATWLQRGAVRAEFKAGTHSPYRRAACGVRRAARWPMPVTAAAPGALERVARPARRRGGACVKGDLVGPVGFEPTTNGLRVPHATPSGLSQVVVTVDKFVFSAPRVLCRKRADFRLFFRSCGTNLSQRFGADQGSLTRSRRPLEFTLEAGRRLTLRRLWPTGGWRPSDDASRNRPAASPPRDPARLLA